MSHTVDHYDVVVAGGGPGGCTAACLLARTGLRVGLFEKGSHPRFHLGESLLPRTLDVLTDLGVKGDFDAQFIPKYGARFVRGATGEESVFRFEDSFDLTSPLSPYAYQGPRAQIDQLLFDQAKRLGVVVHEGYEVLSSRLAQQNDPNGGRVVSMRNLAGPVDGLTDVLSRVLIDATGRDAVTSRLPKQTSKIEGLERTLAIFSHFDGCQRLSGRSEGDIRIVILDQGWGWIIPFRGGRTSIGIVLAPAAIDRHGGAPDLDATFWGIVRGAPGFAAILAHALPVMPLAAVADFSYHVRQKSDDALVRVGDAAGFIDPLFSTGFHLAVKGGALAASAVGAALQTGNLAKGSFDRYDAQVAAAIDTFTGLVQAFYRGELLDLLFAPEPRAVVRKMVTSVLAGDVFFDDPPRWLRELRIRFPPQPASGSPVG